MMQLKFQMLSQPSLILFLPFFLQLTQGMTDNHTAFFTTENEITDSEWEDGEVCDDGNRQVPSSLQTLMGAYASSSPSPPPSPPPPSLLDPKPIPTAEKSQSDSHEVKEGEVKNQGAGRGRRRWGNNRRRRQRKNSTHEESPKKKPRYIPRRRTTLLEKVCRLLDYFNQYFLKSQSVY